MPDPNNYLIEQHKIAFQMICKAANTSAKSLLVDYYVPKERQAEVLKRPHHFFTMVAKDEIPDDYLVIGFCRHPEDRLISCWKDKICGEKLHPGFESRHPGMFQHQMPFEDFCAAVHQIPDGAGRLCDQHFRSQTFDLNLQRIDKLVRVESIEEDWAQARAMIQDRCGVVFPPLGRVNKTQTVQVVVDVPTRVRIFQRFENDFKFLSYEDRNVSHG